jgi:hypothetical protein
MLNWLNGEKKEPEKNKLTEMLEGELDKKEQAKEPTEPEPPKKDPKINRINKISFTWGDGRKSALWLNDYTGNELLKPWRKFLSWYYGRPQSENYMMHYNMGCFNIRRIDLISFSLDIKEAKRGEESLA